MVTRVRGRQGLQGEKGWKVTRCDRLTLVARAFGIEGAHNTERGELSELTFTLVAKRGIMNC